MLTPKSLLTSMMAIFLRPWSMAYFAAAVPCSASEVMVRKKMPLVLPSRASAVSVGDDEAGDTCTTPAGAVTEVRIGIVVEEMMPPMIAHLLDVDQLRRLVDGDRALALAVAGIGDQLAARAEPAGIIEIAERHFHRLGARLPVGSGGTGQFHHEADGDIAIGGDGRQRGKARRGHEPGRQKHLLHRLFPSVTTACAAFAFFC